MTDERGLVISCPGSVSGRAFHFESKDLDPQELRFSLLFWDKLNFPRNNLIGLPLDDNAQYLADLGILTRTIIDRTRLTGGDVVQAFVEAHALAFRDLEEQEPGVWSLGAGKNSITFPDEDLEQGRGVLVRLHNAIPIPEKDVSLPDILEFRGNYQAELLALRHHLEEIYQRIIAAGDGELALNTEIGKLENAISDYIRVSRESKLPFLSTDWTASLNVPAGVAAGLIAFDQSLGVVSSLTAAGVASIAFGPGFSLKRHKAGPTPFQYISSYHDRLF